MVSASTSVQISESVVPNHFQCAQTCSRSTPVDPNAFPMCSDALSKGLKSAHVLCCVVALLRCCVVVLLRCCVAALLRCCVVALLRCCVVSLFCCCVVALLHRLHTFGGQIEVRLWWGARVRGPPPHRFVEDAKSHVPSTRKAALSQSMSVTCNRGAHKGS